MSTGEPDFSYAYRGIRIDPRSTFRYAAPFNGEFKRPGLKRLVLVDLPSQVRTHPVEFLVVGGVAMPVVAGQERKPA